MGSLAPAPDFLESLAVALPNDAVPGQDPHNSTRGQELSFISIRERWAVICSDGLEKKRIMVAVLVQALCMYLSMVLTNYLTLLGFSIVSVDGAGQSSPLMNEAPLHDLAIHWIPRNNDLEWMADMGLFLGFLGWMWFLVTGQVTLFVEYAFSMAFLFLCKNFTQLSTIVPPSDQTCLQRLSASFADLGVDPSRKGWWMFYVSPLGMACNNMVFSGHTASSLLAVMYVGANIGSKGLGKISVLLRILLWSCFLIVVYGLLTIRYHYTVDVVLGVIITVLVYGSPTLKGVIWWFMNRVAGTSGASDA